MSETEIETKKEFDYRLQCITCLSYGRKMLTIGNYSRAFGSLVSSYCFQVESSIEEASICWECHSILRRIAKFQNQVYRANQLLQCGQSHIYGTLSCLTTVINTDTEPHIIYVNEPNIPMKEENELEQSCDDERNVSPYVECIQDCDNISLVEDSDIKIVKTEETVIIEDEVKKAVDISSNWTKKRVLLNRNPKFKILKAKEVDINAMCKKNNECMCMKKLQCDKCDLRFESDNLIMTHFKEVHEKDLVCDVCHLLLTDKAQLLAHLESHTEIYKCSLCDFISNSRNQARKHFVKVHTKIFQCVHCELIFPSRRDFFQHYKEWHEKFICDHCGVSFKMRYCIEDHIRKKHSPFECKPCNKVFARYNGLWLHNKVRHGPQLQAAYCVECDKRYPDVYRYKWHLANSVRHKPKKKVKISCPECDKVFSKNIYMKDHYNLVHLKQYKYRCEDCDKNFIRNAELVKHKKRVHEGILPPKNKICYVCGRGFSTNKILSNHLRTHTGERPFACNACPARFAQRAALAGHARALHRSGRNDT